MAVWPTRLGNWKSEITWIKRHIIGASFLRLVYFFPLVLLVLKHHHHSLHVWVLRPAIGKAEKLIGSQCIHGNSLDNEASISALKGCICMIDKGECTCGKRRCVSKSHLQFVNDRWRVTSLDAAFLWCLLFSGIHGSYFWLWISAMYSCSYVKSTQLLLRKLFNFANTAAAFIARRLLDRHPWISLFIRMYFSRKNKKEKSNLDMKGRWRDE